MEVPSGSREPILESATQVFMEYGFSGARVDEIARRADANKAMIYYHFGSKQALYKAVLLRLFGDVLDEIQRLKSTDDPADQKLRALYTLVVHHFEKKKALPHVILREILAGGTGMDAEASRTLGTILGFVSQTLQDGVSKGLFRPVHPLLFHLTMLAPLMVHFAGASFRERLLPREMPGLALPTNDDMLNHLLSVLAGVLAPIEPSPSVSRFQQTHGTPRCRQEPDVPGAQAPRSEKRNPE
jgi:TetR/AcrR family transcriptional regulator